MQSWSDAVHNNASRWFEVAGASLHAMGTSAAKHLFEFATALLVPDRVGL